MPPESQPRGPPQGGALGPQAPQQKQEQEQQEQEAQAMQAPKWDSVGCRKRESTEMAGATRTFINVFIPLKKPLL